MTFQSELWELCQRHGLAFIGKAKLAKLEDLEAHEAPFFMAESVEAYGGKDTCGPFLVSELKRKAPPPAPVKKAKSVEIIDREKLMNGGFESMADGKFYTSRAKYEQSLKDHGCEIVGRDRPSTRERLRRNGVEA